MIGQSPNITHGEYVEAINAISAAKSLEELAASCRLLVAYKYASYHHIPAIGSQNYEQESQHWVTGLSEDIRKTFDLENFYPDPIRHYVLSKARPFWMSDLLGKENLSDKNSQCRIKFTLENVGDGIITPLFGPYHKRGYIFVGFEHPGEFYDEIFLWQVQALLEAGHNRHSTLHEAPCVLNKLTARENEVLKFISAGKTNPEIAVILGISNSTVAGHVKNIFLKLNAHDRVTVALRRQSFIP